MKDTCRKTENCRPWRCSREWMDDMIDFSEERRVSVKAFLYPPYTGLHWNFVKRCTLPWGSDLHRTLHLTLLGIHWLFIASHTDEGQKDSLLWVWRCSTYCSIYQNCDILLSIWFPEVMHLHCCFKTISSVPRNNKRVFLQLGLIVFAQQQVVQREGKAIKTRDLCYINVNTKTDVKLLFANLQTRSN